jgi:hypothetical protein
MEHRGAGLYPFAAANVFEVGLSSKKCSRQEKFNAAQKSPRDKKMGAANLLVQLTSHVAAPLSQVCVA